MIQERSERNDFQESFNSKSIGSVRRSYNQQQQNQLSNYGSNSLIRPRGDSRQDPQNNQQGLNTKAGSGKKIFGNDSRQIIKSEVSLQGEKLLNSNQRSISLQKLRKEQTKGAEEEQLKSHSKNQGMYSNKFNYRDMQESMKNQQNSGSAYGSLQNSNSHNSHPPQQEEKAQSATVVMQALNSMISVGQLEFKYKIDPSKKSSRSFGITKAYAANTNKGIFRNYNEDRVSIILSISKPFNKNVEAWPKTSFFAVYDGHGGAACSDFLRDNLHLFIVKDESFPQNPIEAIRKGVKYAESVFLQQAESVEDRSGSCAIILLILDDIAYTANIGDSRAILSQNRNSTIKNLSYDHKPEDERQRIESAGGRVYQSVLNSQPIIFQGIKITPPHRVFPGKLSVSRTLGDFEAKSLKHGGNPNVVISDPDIIATKITSEQDFIILACDGVYDRLSTADVGTIFWKNMEETIDKLEKIEDYDIHKQCGFGIEAVMKETFERKSLDNVTLVVVVLEGFYTHFELLVEKRKKQLFQKTIPLIIPPIPQSSVSSSRSKASNSISPVRQRESRGSDIEAPNSARTPLRSGGKHRIQKIGSQKQLEAINTQQQDQQQQNQKIGNSNNLNVLSSNIPLKRVNSSNSGHLSHLPLVNQQSSQLQLQQFSQAPQQQNQLPSNSSLPQLNIYNSSNINNNNNNNNNVGNDNDSKIQTKLSQMSGSMNLRNLLINNLNSNDQNDINNRKKSIELQPQSRQSQSEILRLKTQSLHNSQSINQQKSVRGLNNLQNPKSGSNQMGSSLLTPLKPISSEKLMKKYPQAPLQNQQPKNY